VLFRSTNPGVIVLIDEDMASGGQPGLDAKAVNDAFVAQLAEALRAYSPHAMLTQAMRAGFEAGVARWAEAGAEFLVRESAAAGQPPRPVLAQVSALGFNAKAVLREEVFGPSSLIVRAASVAQALQVLQAVGGSLTVTVWGAQTEGDDVRALVRGAMAIAGRVLFAGVPTGVAVSAGQQHGGPWPSSSRPETTSVGDAALGRFLRPVCLQDAPAWLTARQGQPL
jgi:NADP-dependent aldehyde dehydrogenase